MAGRDRHRMVVGGRAGPGVAGRGETDEVVGRTGVGVGAGFVARDDEKRNPLRSVVLFGLGTVAAVERSRNTRLIPLRPRFL